MATDKIKILEKKLGNLRDKPDSGASGRKKVDVLNELASEVVLSDCGAAEDYAKRALDIAEKMGYHKGEAKCYRLIGLSYEYRARYDETLACYNKALHTSRRIKDKQGIAKAILNIGGIYADLGHFDKALKYQIRALRHFEDLGNKHDIAGSFINIGATYQHLKNFEQGAQYNIEALKIFEKIGHAEGIADAAINIGGCYGMLGDYDGAFNYATKALAIYKELGEILKMAQAYLIIGTICGQKKDDEKALTCYRKALEMYEKVENKKGIAYACNNIGEIQRRLGDFDSAFKYLQRALKTAQEIKAIENEVESHELLSELFEAQHNYEQALNYHKKYTVLKEEFFNAEKSKQIADMRIRYETEKKEKEAVIYHLKNVKLRKEIRERKKIEKELEKHRTQLEELVEKRTVALKKELVKRQRAEEELLKHQNQLIALNHALSLVEEKQRRKTATYLHDNISQALSLAIFKIRSLQESGPAKNVKSKLAEIKEIVAQTNQRTRSLTLEISPPILYELGLEPAVEWLAGQFQIQHGITCSFKNDGSSKPLTDEARILLFQAVRELLTNVSKHARAETVKVSTVKDGNAMRISVEDDGMGFNRDSLGLKIKHNEGFGIFNIKERLHYLGGKLEVNSEKGKGTSVVLIAPLKPTQRKTNRKRR